MLSGLISSAIPSYLPREQPTHVPPEPASAQHVEEEVDGVVGDVELVGDVVEQHEVGVRLGTALVVDGGGDDVAHVLRGREDQKEQLTMKSIAIS